MGKYTEVQRQCSTKNCDHFVADHAWNDKDTNGKTLTDEKQREAAQQERGACYVAGCGCTSYKDDAERATFAG